MEKEVPEEVAQILEGRKVEDIALEVVYRNYRGEAGERRIIPLKIYYGNNEYHKEEQWLLRVWDLGKNAYRDYALKDIIEWRKV